MFVALKDFFFFFGPKARGDIERYNIDGRSSSPRWQKVAHHQLSDV